MNADLALYLYRSASPHLSLDDAENVLATLSDLGYQLEAGGGTGECLDDVDWRALSNILRLSVPLGFAQATAALSGIGRLKFRIRKAA
jgi:hypothetical protein